MNIVIFYLKNSWRVFTFISKKNKVVIGQCTRGISQNLYSLDFIGFERRMIASSKTISFTLCQMYGNVSFLWSIKKRRIQIRWNGLWKMFQKKCHGKKLEFHGFLHFCLHFFQCFVQNFWKHILSPYYWIWNQHKSLVFLCPVWFLL